VLDGDVSWATSTVTAGRLIGMKLDDIFPDGLQLNAIKFYASAANDVLVVRNGSATGAVISKLKSVTGDTLKEWIDSKCLYKPYITYANCTFGTPANAITWLEFLNKPYQ
jgi:hypothetical protein